jgi:hypothetical protein
VVTSLISAFYYLRVVVNMYMKEGDPVVEREFWLDFHRLDRGCNRGTQPCSAIPVPAGKHGGF